MILYPPELIADYQAQGWWQARTLDQLFRANAQQHPARLAIVDAPNRPELVGTPPRRLDYAELAAEVDRTARQLAGAGVGADDIVVIQLPNIVELAVLYLACSTLGAIASPMPVQYRQHEWAGIFETLGRVKAVVAVPSFKGAAVAGPLFAYAKANDSRVLTFCIGSGAGTALDGLPLAPSLPVHGHDGNHVVTVCWTSGTVAQAKGVPRTHNNWLLSGSGLAEVADLRDGDRILCPFPMVNMGGIASSMTTWLHVAGTLVLHHPQDVALCLRQIDEEQVNFTVLGPALLMRLLQEPALLQGRELHSLRCVMSGSAPLSPAMIEQYEARWGIQIVNSFACSEGLSMYASAREVPGARERASLFPRVGIEGRSYRTEAARRIRTRLVDPSTERLITEPGVPGELRVRGPTVFSGYFGRQAMTNEAFDNEGWLRTGDIFEIALDEAGEPAYYRFVERLKDLIIRGGINIAPAEIEHVVQRHPAVREVAVVGSPDAVLGERVCAVVVVAQGHTLSLHELAAFMSSQGVARGKTPERLEIVDALPRNPMGKVLKRELRARFAGEAA